MQLSCNELMLLIMTLQASQIGLYTKQLALLVKQLIQLLHCLVLNNCQLIRDLTINSNLTPVNPYMV